MLEAVSRPLEVSSTIPLTAEQIERLCAIEEYDLWFVIERVEEKGEIAPHLVGQAVREFKKYMALIALGHTEIGMSSHEVDVIWHNFILFTREYSQFCEKVCGRIIHHRPNTSRRPQLPARSITDFASAYRKFFGDLPSIWQSEGMKPLFGSQHLMEEGYNGATGDALLDGDCDATPGPCSSSVGDCDSTGGPMEVLTQEIVGDCDATRKPVSD
jgi:hypothetical protein